MPAKTPAAKLAAQPFTYNTPGPKLPADDVKIPHKILERWLDEWDNDWDEQDYDIGAPAHKKVEEANREATNDAGDEWEDFNEDYLPSMPHHKDDKENKKDAEGMNRRELAELGVFLLSVDPDSIEVEAAAKFGEWQYDQDLISQPEDDMDEDKENSDGLAHCWGDPTRTSGAFWP